MFLKLVMRCFRKCCATLGCKDKSPSWWAVMILCILLWAFLLMYELFGPGTNSNKVLINMGTSEGILPGIAAEMTKDLDTTVADWLDP